VQSALSAQSKYEFKKRKYYDGNKRNANFLRSNSDEAIIGNINSNNNPIGRVHHQSHHPVIIRQTPIVMQQQMQQHQAIPNNDELSDIKEQILGSFRDQMRARCCKINIFKTEKIETGFYPGGGCLKSIASFWVWACSRTGTI